MTALATDQIPKPTRATPASRLTHDRTVPLSRLPSQWVNIANVIHHAMEPEKMPNTKKNAELPLLTPAPANIPRNAKIVTGLERVNKNVVK